LNPFDEKQQEEAKEAMTLESVIALKDINLSIRHGEFVCVIGDVGSGKSSLLNAIIGDLLYLDSAFL
jgi:ABC-type nitrate/sulfonate/bicarbonate transport system ATPase subunit